MKYRNEIQQANYFQVFSVARTPTMPEMQDPYKLYVMDYEVINTILVPENLKEGLKKALLDKSNYSFEENKRCPFVASYAVKIDADLMAIIGGKPCSKIMISPPDEEGHDLYDLAQESNIESILVNILSGN